MAQLCPLLICRQIIEYLYFDLKLGFVLVYVIVYPVFLPKDHRARQQQAFKITFPGNYVTVLYTWDYMQYNLWDTQFLYIDVVEVGRYLTFMPSILLIKVTQAEKRNVQCAQKYLFLETCFIKSNETWRTNPEPLSANLWHPFFCAHKIPKRKVLTRVYEH